MTSNKMLAPDVDVRDLARRSEN